MITSARLRLLPLSDPEARAIVRGDCEGRHWADGYPTDGDALVAQHHLGYTKTIPVPPRPATKS